MKLNCLILFLALGTQTIWSQRLFTVYVEAGADGFTSVGTVDSVADLKKSLRGKEKTLQVVDSSANADLIVHIMSRNERKELGSITTYGSKSDDGKKTTSTSVPSENTIRMVHSVLQVGDFQTNIDAEDSMWRGAADKIANQVEQWTKQNYTRLTEKRSTETAKSKDASLHPGMSPKEVTEAVGEPFKKVTFGQKALWNYKGFQVVFENDKVTDVKF